MKAIVLQGEAGKVSFVKDRPLPKLRPGYLAVDVKAIALNPADWKHVDRSFLNHRNCLSGCDYAGVVADIGQGYSKSWAVGDRICGFVHGGNQHQVEDGAFAERIVVKADIQMRIPEAMPFETAAALGVGVVTCGQGLFQQMGLRTPTLSNGDAEKANILIYGGSSATGSLGIQFAKMAGYSPITICSTHNFDFVKSRGAVAAFDYKDPDCIDKVREFAPNLQYAWDTISLPASIRICSAVLAPGGRYGSLIRAKLPRNDVNCTYSLGYTAVGERVTKGPDDFLDTSADFEFCKNWIQYVDVLLEQNRLMAHPADVRKGFQNVIDGFDLLRLNKVSGSKLVYVV